MRGMKEMATIAVVAATLSGCGTELLGGAQKGDVRAVATNDGNGSEPALIPAADGGAQPQAVGIRGELELAAQVTLIADDGEEVNLVPVGGLVGLRIEGDGEALVARAQVDARTYSAVELTFSQLAADVQGGLVVEGVPLVGAVTVAGAAGMRVRRPLEFTVTQGGSRTIVIDLNAQAWLPRAELLTRSVPAAAVQQAIEVRVR